MLISKIGQKAAEKALVIRKLRMRNSIRLLDVSWQSQLCSTMFGQHQSNDGSDD